MSYLYKAGSEVFSMKKIMSYRIAKLYTWTDIISYKNQNSSGSGEDRKKE